MSAEVKPIRTKADHKAALAEVERLWGAGAGTSDGDRLDVLAIWSLDVIEDLAALRTYIKQDDPAAAQRVRPAILHHASRQSLSPDHPILVR